MSLPQQTSTILEIEVFHTFYMFAKLRQNTKQLLGKHLMPNVSSLYDVYQVVGI